jgi:hypothetical protein
MNDADTIAAFDLPASGMPDPTGDAVVYPDALLFKAGDYPDRNYSMTPEEIRRYADEFSGPVPNELEHVNSFGHRTILDGKLGEVRDVWASRDGAELRGTVVIPKWLDQVWDATRKQVSAAWNTKTKRMNHLGLVIKGRVADAALMAAFSEAGGEDATPTFATTSGERTYDGLSTLQQLHDSAARAGAVCSAASSRKPGDALFHSAAELAAIQKVHDVAVTGGAKCNIVPPPKSGNGDAATCRCSTTTTPAGTDRLPRRVSSATGIPYRPTLAGRSWFTTPAPRT